MIWVLNVSVMISICFQVRVVLKYRHCDGNLCMKVTDDAVVSLILFVVPLLSFYRQCYAYMCVLFQSLQYKTDQAQDVKKIEKLHGKLMRLMVSKESHSGAMETDWIDPWTFQCWTVVFDTIWRLNIFKTRRSTSKKWSLVEVYWLLTQDETLWKEQAPGTSHTLMIFVLMMRLDQNEIALQLF